MNPALQQFLAALAQGLSHALTQPTQPSAPASPAPAPATPPPSAPAAPTTPSSSQPPSVPETPISPQPLYRHPLLHNLLTQLVPIALQSVPLLTHEA